jgi:1,4-alpha-glucan branching enzyme
VEGNIMLQKQYTTVRDEKLGKDVQMVEVTFVLPTEIKAKTAEVLGAFNRWKRGSHPMKWNKELKRWEVTMVLPLGEHQFRYLVDKTEWNNDWDADKYACAPYGGENSVVVCRALDAQSAPA